MSSRVAILYRDELKEYDFGAGHPFRGRRFPQFYLIVHERFKAYFWFSGIKRQFLGDRYAGGYFFVLAVFIPSAITASSLSLRPSAFTASSPLLRFLTIFIRNL
jgi:hypothetical protein